MKCLFSVFLTRYIFLRSLRKIGCWGKRYSQDTPWSILPTSSFFPRQIPFQKAEFVSLFLSFSCWPYFDSLVQLRNFWWKCFLLFQGTNYRTDFRRLRRGQGRRSWKSDIARFYTAQRWGTLPRRSHGCGTCYPSTLPATPDTPSSTPPCLVSP